MQVVNASPGFTRILRALRWSSGFWLLALGVIAPALVAVAGPGPPDPGGPDDSLSILECAHLARHAAPDVRIAGSDLEAARYDSLGATHNRRPAFSIQGGVIIAPEGFYDPILTNLGEYGLKARVEWPLFDGGIHKRARLRATNDAVLASVELDRAQREAAGRAAALAVEVLRLGDRARAQRQTLEWLDRLATSLQSTVRAGMHALSDQLRVELERDGVRSALDATRVEGDAAARELAQLLGRREGAPPVVREPAPDEERSPGEEDSLLVSVRLDRLPELRSAQLREERAGIELEEARRSNALRLDAGADAGLAGSDLTRWVPPDVTSPDGTPDFGDRLRRDAGASVSVGFQLPVLDATRRPAVDARQAQVEGASLRAGLERATQRRLGLDLMARWRAAHERRSAAQGLADRAEDNLVRARSLYTAGAIPLLELLDARRVLDEALERVADARFETRVAQYEAETRR